MGTNTPNAIPIDKRRPPRRRAQQLDLPRVVRGEERRRVPRGEIRRHLHKLIEMLGVDR